MKLKLLLIPCFLLLILSCEKERALDKYYNQEGTFSGSAYTALESTGMYNHFLEGVDSAQLTNQLKNTLVTVVAPSDEAFEAYFAKHGYEGMSSIPHGELVDLIGHHIITWPHSPSSFEQDPLMYKRQSNMPPSTVLKYDHVSQSDTLVTKEAKYLHFYYPEMLNFYGGTPEDYTIMTGSELSPATGFNIYDAQVDSMNPFGNGWVYYVDKVVEPIKNMDEWLIDEPDYSLFFNLYNRFSVYYLPSSDDDVPPKRNCMYQLNRHYRIDMELCFETVGAYETGDPSISLKANSGFSIFAMKNDVLESFINTNFPDWPGFIDSLEIVNKHSLGCLHIGKVIRVIMKPYMFIDRPFFPSQIFSGEGLSCYDGTILQFTEQDIDKYFLGSNGYGYEVNNYQIPRTFKSILKPVFTTPTYKYFAAASEKVELLGFMNAENANYTLLLPTDRAFLNSGVLLLDEYTYEAEYGDGTVDPSGIFETAFVNVDPNNSRGGTPYLMQTDEVFDLVFAHMFIESVTPTSQKQFAYNAPGDYVGVTLDSVWSGGNISYRIEDTIRMPRIIETIDVSETDNGQVFVVDELITSPKWSLGEMLEINPAYSRFYGLCENAGLFVDGLLTVEGNYPTLCVPTNEAIDQYIADGLLPSDEAELELFLRYFFIDRTIFTTETINETVLTLCKDPDLSTEFKIVYKTVDVNGTFENLQVKGTGNSSYMNVIEGAACNVICTDGIIHQIDGVLN